MAFSWGGMGGGAASGAMLGSIFPGIGTAIGAIGGGLLGAFGGGRDASKDDPLAGIRAQLNAVASRKMALAEEVPGLVGRQKQLIGERYGREKEQGIQGIGENVYAERGMGRTSIFDTLRTNLIERLAQGQSADELAAEMAGLQMQSNILGGAGGLYGAAAGVPYPEQQPSALSGILGGAASLGANILGQNWLGEQQSKRLEGMLSGLGSVKQTPGTIVLDPTLRSQYY